MNDYLRPIRDVDLGDAGLVGRKAAVLGALLNAGFPVPDGVVVTVNAFDRALAGDPSADVSMPADIAARLAEIDPALRDQSLAVRSSAAEEDLRDASYAGQYLTVLHVKGERELLDAVRDCWRSAFSEQVTTYAQSHGTARASRVAVLVQRMVPAVCAGNAFSADPVTGERGQVVVNAVSGVGDLMMSGQASPEEWVVRDGEAARRSTGQGAITEEQARAVADLARRVEARLGAPQDIEWAFDDDRLWLLQARPITALPDPPPVRVPIPVEVPEGFWRRDDYGSRVPWSPMRRSIFMDVYNATRHHMFQYSFLAGVEYREVGGWMYTRMVPLDGLDKIMERVSEIVAAVRSDDAWLLIDEWNERGQDALATKTAALRDVDLGALDDEALLRHVSVVLDLVEEVHETHFRLASASMFLVGEFGLLVRDLLGWDVRQTMRLLSGGPGKTTEPALALAECARVARSRPAVRKLLDDPEEALSGGLADSDAEFAERFAAYLRDFCHRSVGVDLTEQTLAERPVLVLGLIRDQMNRPELRTAGLLEARDEAVAEARALLAERPDTDRERFDRALVRAQAAYPVRDDKAFYTALTGGLVRYAVLELGRRLARREQIGREADVFLLTIEEALAALGDGEPRRTLVARREGEREWARVNPGPPVYGEPPAGWGGGDMEDKFSRLPEEAQYALRVFGWVTSEFQSAQGSAGEPENGALRGVAASPGTYTGPVRVIADVSEFGKLRPGDVLVCPETSPEWSVLFPCVGALVTDSGGLLSHPAIIAREYRVPAVLATGRATRTLRDGQVVTVDGQSGVVETVE
ncbi:PEP/pyruvate-binding domain-containing protein [Actinoallomurus iriomotensis]|uniref:Pyruvate, phosphate dikinase n=1 Tax=Actinoallomurus iriomotensis TaxID=478107 RepID=A0A9W6RIM4_9ACTN|nr:PEP/pyruvate-binding domain-containing protein [Actinoallomurus iriomotensis]GLY75495.1 pyruvate, phosphate dikinase [Actinoallomurus iriomotensis]